MAGRKAAAGKSAPAKKAAEKAPKVARISRASQTKALSDRAAKVESNIGGSQSLRDFLTGAGWY